MALPFGTVGQEYSTLSGSLVTASPSDGVTFSLDPANKPDWLSIDSNGQLRGVPVVDIYVNNMVTIIATNGTQTTSKSLPITVNFYIVNDSLPVGKVGQEYSTLDKTIIKTNPNDGATVFTLEKTPSYPSWLSMDQNGQLRGVPTEAITNADIRITATRGDHQQSVTLQLTIADDGSSGEVDVSVTDYKGMQNTFATIDITISGTYTDISTEKDLPKGLSLQQGDGYAKIQGYPKDVGNYAITIAVSVPNRVDPIKKSFNITVETNPDIVAPSNDTTSGLSTSTILLIIGGADIFVIAMAITIISLKRKKRKSAPPSRQGDQNPTRQNYGSRGSRF